MHLGANQKVALMTTDFSRGRILRAVVVAAFMALPQLPVPPVAAPYIEWVSGLGMIVGALLTTTASTR